MNVIDTEYATLAEIDSEIVRFYSEEVRTKVIGHSEPDEFEMTHPITEDYTVIVLNNPSEVTYEVAQGFRGRRHPETKVKAVIAEAIEWEDFAVNHDGYLAWLVDLERWETEQPLVQMLNEEGVPLLDEAGEPVMVVADAPARPEIDMADRREVYEKVVTSFDSAVMIQVGSEVSYDDDAFTTAETPVTEPKPAEEVAAYYAERAKVTRDEAVEADIEVFDVVWQVHVVNDEPRLGRAINAAETAGLPADYQQVWILADNSARMTTAQELRQVLAAKAFREGEIFAAYSTWRAGDKQEEFTL